MERLLPVPETPVRTREPESDIGIIRRVLQRDVELIERSLPIPLSEIVKKPHGKVCPWQIRPESEGFLCRFSLPF